ncbi:MAG: twitching motility protein PilT [Myxococcales bacterium]|nr:twitching motility protein PilT [Myxococcales bacterium]
MKQQPVSGELLPKVIKAMEQSALFHGLSEQALAVAAEMATLEHYVAGETIMKAGSPATGFALMLNGSARKLVQMPKTTTIVETDLVVTMETFGELDMLLEQPRAATYVTADPSLVIQFDEAAVQALFEQVPAFGRQLGKALAARMRAPRPDALPLRRFDLRLAPPGKDVVELLPAAFIARQRVIPVKSEAGRVLVGFVDPLSRRLYEATRSQMPGTEVIPVSIDAEDFRKLAMARGVSFDALGSPSVTGVVNAPSLQAQTVARVGLRAKGDDAVVRQHGPRLDNNPRLDRLLKRMVAEGASDLHLSAQHRPRWRIDGEIHEISEARVLGPETVMELFEPIMQDRNLKEFYENDVDFAYAIPNVARFRVNLFADRLGYGAVLRQIPDKILTFEQLGLPEAVRKMCDHPKGMVLVTGPTGSGKSTSLAAMVDYINKNRRTHIITLEDPIEFVHESRKSLVNQREVGEHTVSFKRALKAALREDPDIVLVGEMRDIETVALALETANTGHLVFGTLHTATAISTIDRIIDLFPHAQQSQVRAVLADCLKGVVSQTLCRKRGGGRIAALEILVGSAAISNLIREGKSHQIANIQMTAKKQGNKMLNEQLEKLVIAGKVDYEEALSKAIDKGELAKRFGREYFEE